MGGNAIPKARRVTKEVYDHVIKHIAGQSFLVMSNELRGPDRVRIHGEIVKSYRQKQDFGDIDVVIDDRVDITDLFAHYRPKKCSVNGNVMSIAYDGIQVDFIRTPTKYIQSTLDYYAYNDLGNLLGKLARKLGFKYGNKGLAYRYTTAQGNKIEDIIVTSDLKQIHEALGLSHGRYNHGFETLEDMFKFVTSSLYFDPGMYRLENNPGRDHNRDAKRKTYMAFLEWMETRKMKSAAERGVEELVRTVCSDAHHEIRKAYPHITTRIAELNREHEDDRLFRMRFNGTVISQLTGLLDNELGKFAEWFRLHHKKDNLAILNDSELHALILSEFRDYEADERKEKVWLE